MAWLTRHSGNKVRAHRLNDQQETLIGSGEGVALRLEGEGIAARHCELVPAGGGFEVRDLGGGVLVNGQRVERVVLGDGDVLELGTEKLTFLRELPQKAASLAAAPTVPAAAPSLAREARPAVRTAATRARSSRSQRADQPLMRRRLRESHGLKTPALMGVLALSLCLGGFVLYKVLTKPRENITELLGLARKAKDVQNFALAQQYLEHAREQADPSHPLREAIDELYAEVSEYSGNVEKLEGERAESLQYNGNVKPFYDQYIDTDKKDLKGDPATARYFVEYRALPFVERFKDSPNRGTVNLWVQKLKGLYQESDPFPDQWWDYDRISLYEQNVYHYGEAYRVLNEYLEKHPDSKQAEVCRSRLKTLKDSALRNWEMDSGAKLDRCLEARPEPNFSGALAHAQRAWQTLGAIPEIAVMIHAKVVAMSDLAGTYHYAIPIDDFQLPQEGAEGD